MVRHRLFQRGIFLKQSAMCVVIALAMASLAGCAPLKKKFTREKKKNKEVEFIPVLDPIDYPPARVSAEERYSYHYSLWWVWHKDLIQKIDNKDSDKSQVYLLKQIVVQLSEMKKWVSPDTQAELDGILADLDQVLASYEMSPQVRNVATMRSKLDRIAKEIRKRFDPELMKEKFIQ